MRILILVLLLFLPLWAQSTAPLRIVAIGDGHTEGEGDDRDRGGYPGRLQDRLQGIRPGSVVRNLGHAGWTTDMVIQGYDNKRSSLTEALEWKPDVALLWIGTQDLFKLYNSSDPKPEDEKADQLRFRQNIRNIIGQLKGTRARVYVATIDDPSRRPIAQKREVYTGISAGELGLMSKQAKQYNLVLRDEARRQKCPLVDLGSGDLFLNPLTLWDGNNLNGKGYDDATQRWWAVLKP